MIAGSAENGSKKVIETVFCKPTKSLLSMPLDVLGRGHRWAGAPKLARRVWEQIIWCEIGDQIAVAPIAEAA